jgi:hypothetical protein
MDDGSPDSSFGEFGLSGDEMSSAANVLTDSEKGTEQLSCDYANSCCSILASRMRALRITKSFRMVATIATFATLPRVRSPW